MASTGNTSHKGKGAQARHPIQVRRSLWGCSGRKSHGVKFLKAVDGRLRTSLKDGTIRLVRAEFLRSDANLTHIVCRQELEAREKRTSQDIFVAPRHATRLLDQCSRSIGVLTYGWTTPDDPDVTGTYLASVRRFLRSDLGAHIVAIFWDFLSLPQKPRTAAEDEQFGDALECMGDLYASALGTMVMRHRTIPTRPPGLDGLVALHVEPPHTCRHPSHEHELGVSTDVERPCDLCDGSTAPMYSCLACDVDICFSCCKASMADAITAYEPAIRLAFSAEGSTQLLQLALHDGREWRLRFASHMDAQAAVLSAMTHGLSSAGLSNATSFLYFNQRPYAGACMNTAHVHALAAHTFILD